VERGAKLEGKNMTMIIAPKSQKAKSGKKKTPQPQADGSSADN